MTASKIEWTDRSDWNPVRGCSRVSPGCGGPGPHGGFKNRKGGDMAEWPEDLRVREMPQAAAKAEAA